MVYTVEVLTDKGWKLVLATDDLQKAYNVNPLEYNGKSSRLSRWKEGEVTYVDEIIKEELDN